MHKLTISDACIREGRPKRGRKEPQGLHRKHLTEVNFRPDEEAKQKDLAEQAATLFQTTLAQDTKSNAVIKGLLSESVFNMDIMFYFILRGRIFVLYNIYSDILIKHFSKLSMIILK